MAVFYLGGQAKPVLFPRSQNAQIVLNPLGVVVDNIILNHLNKRFPGSKVAAIVTFALENTPKAFHWTVVNAVGHARHTLYHFVLLQHLVEFAVQELKDSSSNIARFIENAKRYSEIPELTAEILRIFIKRVEVGERTEKYSRTAPQEVRIYYRDIGLVDELPQSMADSMAEEIPNEVS